MNINVDHLINSLDACPLSFSKALGGTFAGVLINNKTQVKGLEVRVFPRVESTKKKQTKPKKMSMHLYINLNQK